MFKYANQSRFAVACFSLSLCFNSFAAAEFTSRVSIDQLLNEAQNRLNSAWDIFGQDQSCPQCDPLTLTRGCSMLSRANLKLVSIKLAVARGSYISSWQQDEVTQITNEVNRVAYLNGCPRSSRPF